MENNPNIIAVIGPTAAGKTAVAHRLALLKNGEVVNADARQVYAHMRIGVAQPDFLGDAHEIEGVPYHLFEIIQPNESLAVAQYVTRAYNVIADILAREKTPILVGGTGFYIDSVCRGAIFGEKKHDALARQLLEQKPLNTLVVQLQSLSPEIAGRTDCDNKRRVVRALERILQQEPDVTYTNPYTVSYVGVQPDPVILKERIAQRVDTMIERGLEYEVRTVIEQYGISIPAMSAIGYREWISYFDGRITIQEVVEQIKKNTWQYARRQMTWFRKNSQIYWI
jgi:tRNA dimethylallyltransferase